MLWRINSGPASQHGRLTLLADGAGIVEVVVEVLVQGKGTGTPQTHPKGVPLYRLVRFSRKVW